MNNASLIGIVRVFFMAVIFALLCIVSRLSFCAETFEEKYGPELKSVPYYLRIQYANETGKPWSEATYDERYDYLEAQEMADLAATIEEEQANQAQEVAEYQEALDREARKTAEQLEEFERQRIKDEKKYAEEMKKYEYMKKSMDQKQKIINLRNQSLMR